MKASSRSFYTERKPPNRKGGRKARLAKHQQNSFPLVEKGMANYTQKPDVARVCVITCGAIAHEIVDIIDANALEHIALTCLPAKLHNTPEKIVPAMERAIKQAKNAGFETIFCGYADCGTGGALDRLLEKENVARLPGAHCYAFFSGVDTFIRNSDKDMRAFFLTDFLARHFDKLTWKPLGLEEHPELLDDYFGAYEKIVFLSQKPDATLLKKAEEIAKRLGLAFEHRQTGYGDLPAALSNT